MLINLTDMITRYGLKITGVIHCGAHILQEFDDYQKNGITNIVAFEPCVNTFETLIGKYSDQVICIKCALGSGYELKPLYKETRNGGQSNSLLKPKKHTEYYPDIVFDSQENVSVEPLDGFELNLNSEKVRNFLNIDTQGSELEVLKGATETLSAIDYIYLECNREELYEGCPMVEEIDLFLSPTFNRVETKWTNQGWGDCLYIRSERYPEGFLENRRF